eukprot:jgi/Mesvir1/29542/Mv21127-RA.1
MERTAFSTAAYSGDEDGTPSSLCSPKRTASFSAPSVFSFLNFLRLFVFISDEVTQLSSSYHAGMATLTMIAGSAPSKARTEVICRNFTGSFLISSGVYSCVTTPLASISPHGCLVGAPEMGEYSQMTWRAFGDLLNGMDCRELSRMSERSEYHAVAVSLAMGLQGVQYCFSGCHRCNRSPRSMKYTGLAD